MLTLRRDKEVTRTVLPEGVHVDGPRRAYTIDYKIKILRECAEPGASVAGVARRNDLNSNMVFRWRREYRQGRLTGGVSTAGGTTPAVEFVPVKITNNESAWKGTKKTRGKALALLLEKASEPRLLKLFFRTACVSERCGRYRSSPAARSEHCWKSFMIQLPAGTRVYLACRPTDMRKGFNGLSAEAANVLQKDPYSSHVFVFRGKSGDYVKILYWDGTGMCLFAKRLERDRFVWPPIVDDCLHLTPAQLALLLEGMDWRRTIPIEMPRQPVFA